MWIRALKALPRSELSLRCVWSLLGSLASSAKLFCFHTERQLLIQWFLSTYVFHMAFVWNCACMCVLRAFVSVRQLPVSLQPSGRCTDSLWGRDSNETRHCSHALQLLICHLINIHHAANPAHHINVTYRITFILDIKWISTVLIFLISLDHFVEICFHFYRMSKWHLVETG